jgi:hypothetical protein
MPIQESPTPHGATRKGRRTKQNNKRMWASQKAARDQAPRGQAITVPAQVDVQAQVSASAALEQARVNEYIAQIHAGTFRTPSPRATLYARIRLCCLGGSMAQDRQQVYQHISSYSLPAEYGPDLISQLVKEYNVGECNGILTPDQLCQIEHHVAHYNWAVPKAEVQHWDTFGSYKHDFNHESDWTRRNLVTKEEATSCLQYDQDLTSDSPPAFPQFARFPKEMQDKIWGHALDIETNTIVLDWRSNKTWDGTLLENRFVNVNGPPKLLHTCHDSRELGLKRYTKAFGTWLSPAMTYVDFTKNVIFIKTKDNHQLPEFVSHLLEEEMNQVNHLAIPYRDMIKNARQNWHHIARPLTLFKNAKSLELVCGNGREDVYRAFATLDLDRNVKMWEIVHTYLTEKWQKAHPGQRIPWISMKVVDSVQAHKWAIDNMVW